MKEYTVRVYEDKTKWLNSDGEFHREDGPAVEYADGYKSWWINGKYHREDGPAIEYTSGDKQWWINGKLHREDGPAIEYASGYKSWWINGKRLTEEEFNRRSSKVELTMDEIANKFNININQLKIKK